MPRQLDRGISLRAPSESDADVPREMIQYIAQRMMEMDVEGRCGAAFGERSAERTNSRNGYRNRLWRTRADSVDLKIPRLWSTSCFPGFLEPRRTSEKALAALIQEAYVQGVSTRSVDELVKTLGMARVSKSQVWRLCAEIDERVGAFLNRPIEGDWPYLWIDATYVKRREAGRIVSVAVIIGVGVNTEGQRQTVAALIRTVFARESDSRRVDNGGSSPINFANISPRWPRSCTTLRPMSWRT